MQNTIPAPTTPTLGKLAVFRHEARSLARLAVPLVAGWTGSFLIGMINTYFLGPLGEVPLAAVSLTTSISVILFAGLFGLLGPIGYLIGMAYGANDTAKISEVLTHGRFVGLGAGLLGSASMAALLFALPFLGQPREVIAVITPFWLLTSLAFIPFCVTFVYKQFYDATDRSWTGVVLSLIPVAINIPLTGALVNGAFGLPGLGLDGAGWSSLISASIGTLAIVAHFHGTAAFAPNRIPTAWRRTAFAEQLREGLPMGVQYVFEGGAVAVAGILIGLLGATALAANQVVFSVMGLLYVIPLGMSAAVGIRVAQASGGGERSRARGIGVSGMIVVSIWTVLFTFILMTASTRVAELFVAEPAVVAVAALMFMTVGAMQIFDGIQSVGVGVLRGVFDNRYPTVVSLIAYWLIALPLSLLFGFVLNLGGAGVWAGFGGGLLVASVLLVRRLWRVTAA